jgi:threonine dehydratase
MLHVLPTIDDVEDASERVADWILPTPVIESEWLSQLAGTRLLLKAESLQHGGSFKIRGALNRMLQLSYEERRAGVVAFSSGNHAQSVALAAHWLGVPATIVMPADAPRVKIEATRRWGAQIVPYDRASEDREAIAARLAEERGAALIPPFDHPDIIAGQGGVGLELAQAARQRRMPLDAVYVPCSGGGLAAGCALALSSFFPDCAIHAVEPAGFDDTARSLARGEREIVRGGGSSLCDSLLAPTPGAITFAINRHLLTGAVSVSDEEVKRAVALAARHLKLVLEPSGAAALAAVMQESRHGYRRVGVILSGGNIDPELFAAILGEYSDV